jgi:hypothetical protein
LSPKKKKKKKERKEKKAKKDLRDPKGTLFMTWIQNPSTKASKSIDLPEQLQTPILSESWIFLNFIS